MFQRGRFLAVLLAAFAVSSCQKDEASSHTKAPSPPLSIIEGGTERPTKLIVGLTPFLPASKLNREFELLVEYLGKHLGLPIEVV